MAGREVAGKEVAGREVAGGKGTRVSEHRHVPMNDEEISSESFGDIIQ